MFNHDTLINAEIEALRQAEEEQIRRIETIETRLRAQDDARQSAVEATSRQPRDMAYPP